MRDVWVQLENAEGREFLVRPDEVAALEASTKDDKGNALTSLIIAGVSFANVVKGTPRQIANKLHEALSGDSVGQPAPAAPASKPAAKPADTDTEPPPADVDDKDDAAGDPADELDDADELDSAAAELASELAADGDANAAQ